MKKIVFLALTFCICAIGSMSTASCKKESHKTTIEKMVPPQITADIYSGNIYNHYESVSLEDFVWRWRRFDNNQFIFDLNFVKDDHCEIFDITSTKSSLLIDMADGTILELNKVSGDSHNLAFNLMSDSNTLIKCSFSFRDSADYVAALMSFPNLTETKSDINNGPGAGLLGPIVSEVIRLAIEIVYDQYKIHCERIIANGIRFCQCNHCTPHTYNCAVSCRGDNQYPESIQSCNNLPLYDAAFDRTH